MNTETKNPPKNARRIMRVADLPPLRDMAEYEVTNGDEPRKVSLRKRQRQVVDLLMLGPVYCASPVRISDMVHILKREHGIDIETEMFPGDEVTGTGSYGVYFLRSQIRRLKPLGVAA